MKIHMTQPCPNCQGDAIQVHPLWAVLYDRQEKDQSLTAAEYFLEHHILTPAERPLKVVPCQNCNGEGEIRAWVPLQRFLELVVQQTRLFVYKLLGGAPL